MTGLQVCTWVWQLGSCPFSALFYTLFHIFQHPSIPTHLTFSHLPLFSLLFIHLDFCFIFIYSLYSLVFMLFHSLLCFCYLFFFCFFFVLFCFCFLFCFVWPCLAIFWVVLSLFYILLAVLLHHVVQYYITELLIWAKQSLVSSISYPWAQTLVVWSAICQSVSQSVKLN